MKKIIFLISSLFMGFFLFSCNEDHSLDKVYDEIIEKLNIPKSTACHLDIPESVIIDGVKYNVRIKSNSISLDGSVSLLENDVNTKYEIEISEDGKSQTFSKEHFITIIGYKNVESIVLSKINLPTQISDNIQFVSSVDVYNTTFNISYDFESDVLSKTGVVTPKYEDEEVKIKIEYNNNQSYFEKEVVVTVLASEKIKEVINTLAIPEKTDKDISFPSELTIDGQNYLLHWETDSPCLTYRGRIYPNEEDTIVNVTLLIETEENIYEVSFVITVIGNHEEELIKEELIKLEDTMPKETFDDVSLPKNVGKYNISWTSSDSDFLSNSGVYQNPSVNQTIKLTAKVVYNLLTVEHQYEILVKALTDEEKVGRVMEEIEFVGAYANNVELKTTFKYNVTGVWTSKDTSKVLNDGTILANDGTTCVLNLVLSLNDTQLSDDFTINLVRSIEGENMEKEHILIDRAASFQDSALVNLVYKDEKIVLKDNENEGYYNSPIYNVKGFDELVASWAAVTDQSATCELMVKVRVNGVWSKYFSYQEWGLGRNNKSVDSSDDIARMSTDEILIKTGLADAYQYKIILRRYDSESKLPVLSLVAVTINLPNYTYAVDSSTFPSEVKHDVPKLYQGEVPTIGGIICSATSSTMLLKYKGHNFSEYDSQYEHRYIAGLVRDYGANIYGNWVFNCVGMSAFGEDSYFQRMYSFDELKEHLINVGPVAASIKGNTGLYTTQGHLIVVVGYKVVGGQTYVLCNDPNINNRFGNYQDGTGLFVYYEYPLETFMAFWRNVVYVIE